jgi:hypothetical protein
MITNFEHVVIIKAWFAVFLVACIAADPTFFTAFSTCHIDVATIASLELLARSTADRVAGTAESDHSA